MQINTTHASKNGQVNSSGIAIRKKENQQAVNVNTI